MQIDGKSLAVIVAVIVAVAGGAYLLGMRQAGQQAAAPAQTASTTVAPAAPAQPAPLPQAGRLEPGAPMPSDHPQLPQAPAQTAAPQSTAAERRFTHFRVGNRNIKAMLADGDVVWVGTSGGVIRYDTSNDQHRLYDVRSGLLSNGVFHLSKLNGRLVVGTYGGGFSLLRDDGESWDTYNIQHGLGDAFVYDFLHLSNGDIWIATWSGANRVRGGALDDRTQWDLYTVENTDGGLPNDWVYGLAEGKNGEVWMATEGGLARFKDGKWQHWTHKEGLGAPYEQVRDNIEFKRDPAKESSHHARQKIEQGLGEVDVAYNPNYIVSLLVAEDGVVWAGTWGGGLARFDGETWRNYTVSDGLPANHVFMLAHDRQGRMWVGTSAGLARFDGERFHVLTVADGLFANNVFSMADSHDGTMWVGSFGGVARISGL